jgi:outer membrane protease
MEDRDWIALDYPSFLTHYSVHDNRTENAMLFDVNLGVSFVIFEKYLLKTFISYSFMNFSWTATGGSFLYPPNNSGHFYDPAKKTTGTYEQTWNILSPGIAICGEFNSYFDIELSFKITPFIWVTAKDEHLLRVPVLEIIDEAAGGLFIEPGFLFSYKPNSYLALTFSFSYRNISFSRGIGKYYENGIKTAEASIGTGYTAFDAGLTVRFNLF